MDEQTKETTENEKTEVKSEDTGTGNKYETTPLIERARQEREAMDASNKKKEELLNREEQLMAKRALGGMSEAGKSSPKKEVLSDLEYSKKVESGEINPLKEDGFK